LPTVHGVALSALPTIFTILMISLICKGTLGVWTNNIWNIVFQDGKTGFLDYFLISSLDYEQDITEIETLRAGRIGIIMIILGIL
jgi:hypothetical protein